MEVKKIVTREYDPLYNRYCTKMSYKCGNCGKSISSKYFKYCPYCGTKIEFK